MAPNPPTNPASPRAQILSLKRSGRPVAARPRNVVNSTAWSVRCARVKRWKNLPVAVVCSVVFSASTTSSGMIASVCLVLDLVIARADQPQDGVNHKESENAGQQQVHEQPHEIERGVQLAVVRIGMRLILH